MTGLARFNPISAKAKLIGGGVLALIVAGLLAYAFLRVYNAGVGTANTKIVQYENKVKDLNNKLLQKEIIVRERVINNYHTRTIVRTKVEYKNRDVIRTVVPEQFRLSQGWIYAHDQSAQGKEIDPALASNPNPSEVSDRAALTVVDVNYNLAHRNADKLEALQDYLRQMGLTNEPQTTNRPK